jgi:stringent starvation protein B
MDKVTKAKRVILEECLKRGMTFIEVDTRVEGVDVPTRIGDDFALGLNLSYNFVPPDLDVSDWGIKATLKFGAEEYRCAVPWAAIWGIKSAEAADICLFSESIPREIVTALHDQARRNKSRYMN